MKSVHGRSVHRPTRSTRAELKGEAPSQSTSLSAATVRKCQHRDPPRPDTLNCTLTPAYGAVVIKIRRTLGLPLNERLVVVREFLNPAVSRSGLARCMKRHGVNRGPVEDKDAPNVLKTFQGLRPWLRAGGHQVAAANARRALAARPARSYRRSQHQQVDARHQQPIDQRRNRLHQLVRDQPCRVARHVRLLAPRQRRIAILRLGQEAAGRWLQAGAVGCSEIA